jgi:hypothetical protein
LPFRNYGNAANRNALIDQLIDGLRAVLPSLIETSACDIAIPGCSWDAWVYRNPKGRPGIELCQFRPVERASKTDLRKHLHRKLKKLLPYKMNGFRTLFLLEASSPSIMPFMLREALFPYEQEFGDTLDELWEIDPKFFPDGLGCTSYELDSFRSKPGSIHGQ